MSCHPIVNTSLVCEYHGDASQFDCRWLLSRSAVIWCLGGFAILAYRTAAWLLRFIIFFQAKEMRNQYCTFPKTPCINIVFCPAGWLRYFNIKYISILILWGYAGLEKIALSGSQTWTVRGPPPRPTLTPLPQQLTEEQAGQLVRQTRSRTKAARTQAAPLTRASSSEKSVESKDNSSSSNSNDSG